MIGHADDTLLYCIAAAGFVVLAHGVDAIMPRRRRTGGNPLALALLALGVVALAVGGLFAKSSTDLLAVLASAAAVVVSALPLTGVLDRDEEQPPNPWDRAYHVHRDRVAHLLGVRPPQETSDAAPRTAPSARTGATAVTPTTATPATGANPTSRAHRPTDPTTPRPGIVLASPYRRAHETARIALAESPLVDKIVVDERLRERDLGIFDGLTGLGIREKYPEESERRKREGKFYYRPPGGESWTDVALRVRSILGDIRNEYDGERVWVFSHQAVIMSFRFVIESLDEETLLGIDTDTPMANCSRTIYRRSEKGNLELDTYADTRASDLADAPRTHEAPKHQGDNDA